MRLTYWTFVAIVGTASLVCGQDSRPRVSPADPPNTQTARFGNPTSTARAYQDFKLVVVKEIKKDEIIFDKTPLGDDVPVKFTQKTKFIHDGNSAKVADLKVGDQVFVHGKFNKRAGVYIIDTIAWGVVGKKMKGQGINR